jgi:hypothetical protein
MRTKVKKKGLNLTSKQGARQDYVIQKQEQEHKMCKTNVKTNIYYANTCKHEHEKNMTRLWCKIVPKTGVEQIEGNEGSYSYLYPLGDLTQGNLQGSFYVCIK